MNSMALKTKNWFSSIWYPKTFQDLEWFYKLNPTITTHVPVNDTYRKIAPASQPAYEAPKNELIHHHAYYTRDTRRAFPQTLVYTQSELRQLAIQQTMYSYLYASF